MPFDNYPAVDGSNNFPAVIRSAIAAYTELTDKFFPRVSASMLAAQDLNTYVTSGTWNIQSNATASGGSNYPIALSGHLEVLARSDGTTVIQRYTGYASPYPVYLRILYAASWSAWYQISLPTGGTSTQFLRGDKTWQTLDKTAVGLSNVDNTTDANKPLSTAEVAALALKAPLASPAFTGTPTGITKTHVGLANVDNTSDVSKPISTAVQTALDLLPKGLLYKKLVGGNTGGVADAIVDNIATFTFKAGRRYRIVWDTSYYFNATGDLFYCSINTAPTADAASNLANLTLLQGRTKGINGISGSTQHTGIIQAYVEPVGSDLTVQLKFRAQRVVGGNTMIFVGNSNENRFYYIYDDGAQAIGSA